MKYYILDMICTRPPVWTVDVECVEVWPMGLPPHDVVRQELENCEDLAGTQESKLVCIPSPRCAAPLCVQVLDPQQTELWFATKQLQRDTSLAATLGTNEKSKVTAL